MPHRQAAAGARLAARRRPGTAAASPPPARRTAALLVVASASTTSHKVRAEITVAGLRHQRAREPGGVGRSGTCTSSTSCSARIGTIALVIAALGIANALLAAVRERRREIGVLKAIGARDRDVLRWFLVEALLAGAPPAGRWAASGPRRRGRWSGRRWSTAHLVAQVTASTSATSPGAGAARRGRQHAALDGGGCAAATARRPAARPDAVGCWKAAGSLCRAGGCWRRCSSSAGDPASSTARCRAAPCPGPATVRPVDVAVGASETAGAAPTTTAALRWRQALYSTAGRRGAGVVSRTSASPAPASPTRSPRAAPALAVHLTWSSSR